jgi:SAM-dependent methyltransferase
VRPPSTPLPPDELIDRVTTGVTEENAGELRDHFRSSGQRSVRDIERALASVDRTLDSYSRALDFGCGCGRILAWLEPLAETCELHGIDIDEAAIAWCQAHIPFGRFSVAPHRPPTEYPDEHFDLIFNHSVLTHLDEHHQDLWLEELWRITKPGGTVILTVHGDHAFAQTEQLAGVAGPVWRERLESDGILFIEQDSYVGSAFPGFYHTTFHASWYVFEHWARLFRLRAYIPESALEFQDTVVLERSEDKPPAPVRVRPHGGPASASQGAALGRVRATLARGVVPVYKSRFGTPGELSRRLLLRIMRPFTSMEREVDRDLADAIAELQAQLDEMRATAVAESRVSPVVQDALNRQAERMNRLEADLRRLGERLEAGRRAV